MSTVTFAAPRLVALVAAFVAAAACAPADESAPPVTGAAASPRTALGAGVTQVAVFNDPHVEPNWVDNRIRDRIRSMIQSTVLGDSIRAAIYSLSDSSITTALLAAQGRGVSVYVVHSGHDAYNTQGQRLTDSLKSSFASRHVRCGGSNSTVDACISGRDSSVMHSKFFLLSRTVDAGATKTRVVAVTSANMTYRQAGLYNNLVITAGDQASYQWFVKVFDDMYYYVQRGKNNNYRNGPSGFLDSPNGRLQSFFFPRAASNGGTGPEASTDDVAISLSYLTYASGCSVRAAQATFTGQRLPILWELMRIRRMGCSVQLAYTDINGTVKDSLLAAGAQLRRVRTPRANGDTTAIHSKYYITYGGTPGSYRLFTGSHNWTGDALRLNDEVLLKLYEQAVIDSFAVNFNKIWSRGVAQ